MPRRSPRQTAFQSASTIPGKSHPGAATCFENLTALSNRSSRRSPQDKVDDLNDVPDLERTFIPKLSSFVGDIDDQLKPLLRADDDDTGVVVIAQSASTAIDTGVQSGDIIRAINRTQLQSVSQLQATVRHLNSGDPVVLQIERGGHLQYLAFEMD